MQAEPVVVGTTPVSLTANLEPGCYLAQPHAVPGMAAILYATADAAPADDADYFTAVGRRVLHVHRGHRHPDVGQVGGRCRCGGGAGPPAVSELAAPLEVRVSGRTLTGAAMVYGSRAKDRPRCSSPAASSPSSR